MARKRGPKGLKGRCIEFLEWLEKPNRQASSHGLQIDYREFLGGKRKHPRRTLHVIIKDEDGNILVHYWPASKAAIVGKEICDGVKHTDVSPDDAVELAILHPA
jgi:hypothetical protein